MIAAVAWMQLLRFTRAGHRDLMFARWAFLIGAELMLLLPFACAASASHAGAQQSLLLNWLDFICWQQMAGALLLGPALAAGSITDEKTTRTLEHLLIAPLEGRDIVWGKWLALCFQLAFVLLPGVPAIAVLAGLAGIPPGQTLGRVLFPFLTIPAVVAVSLLASTLARLTSQAMTAVYSLLAALVAGAWLAGRIDWFDPLPVRAWADWAWAAFVWLAPVPAFVLLAGALLRPVYFRQIEARPEQARRDLPPIGDDPIGWREAWLVGRGVPLLGAIPAWLGLLGVAALTMGIHLVVIANEPTFEWGWLLVPWRGFGQSRLADDVVGPLGLGVALLGPLLMAVRASASVSSERARRTWDDMLLLPISTGRLLHLKLMGAMRAAVPYQWAYLLAALPGAWLGGWWCLLHLALLWLMSWPLLYFAVAVGLSCSVRSGGSWQAVVEAGVWWGGRLLVQAFMLSCVACTFAAPLLALATEQQGVTLVVVAYLAGYLLLIALVCHVNAQHALGLACEWIGEHERVREPELAAPEEPE